MVVSSQIDNVVSKDEVMVRDGEMEYNLTNPKKLDQQVEKKSTVEQFSTLKDDNVLCRKKGRDVA